MIPFDNMNFPINPDTMLKERFAKSFDFMKNQVQQNIIISFFPQTKSILKKMDIPFKEYIWLYPFIELLSINNLNIITLPFGANIASMMMEELIYCNADTFIIIGLAGSINDNVKAHELVLIDRCLKEDGVSQFYSNESLYSLSSSILNEKIEDYLQSKSLTYHKGDCWTIASPYRESPDKIEKYSKSGIVCVDMEAAALFTIGQYYNVNCSAILSISDELKKDKWIPHFKDKEIRDKPKLLIRLAMEILS